MPALGLYDGFKNYLAPSEDEYVDALQRALVVLDTNVLLSLYKYNEETRSDYLGALAKVGDRLWVPHQVVLEFWRSRRSVLVTIKQNYSGITNSLTSTHRQARENLGRWARASATSTDDLKTALDDVFGQMNARIAEHIATLVDPAGPTADDRILTQLDLLLAAKVEPTPDPQERAEWIEIGKTRVARQIPPGYLDAPKDLRDAPDGATGDYLVWRAAMAEASGRGMDLLIITGDMKEDWWVQQDGRAVSPRPELAEEYRDVSGGRSLYLLQPSRFLELSARGLGAEVSAASIENVEQIAEEDEAVGSSGDVPWSGDGVQEMLRRLDARKPGVFQGDVIRWAAKHRGIVSRNRIFRIAKRDPEKDSLNGMTRPVTGVQRSLVQEGIIESGTEPMFTLHYEGGTLAQISIPTSVVEILREERTPAEAVDEESNAGPRPDEPEEAPEDASTASLDAGLSGPDH